MKTYLVGGAVRDKLMRRSCEDYDWVVVGSTEQEMLEKGFQKVGADFPVFLHPESGSEYALARSENSTGDGYQDFETCVGTVFTTEDGKSVRTINPDLLQKFICAGFDLETDYEMEELIRFFHSF